MIIMILGNIGSGKSVSCIREILRCPFVYTNFNLKGVPNYQRLKISDIIAHIKDDKGKDMSRVNWEFWENARKEHKYFSIFIDEVHNVISSRRAMSKSNILMSRWLSQIRKIFSDSPHSHLYLISQTLRKVDVDFRELAHIVIDCRKGTSKDGKVWIKQKYYEGVQSYLMGISSAKVVFLANPYFKYYDSHQLITFSDAEEYV